MLRDRTDAYRLRCLARWPASMMTSTETYSWTTNQTRSDYFISNLLAGQNSKKNLADINLAHKLETATVCASPGHLDYLLLQHAIPNDDRINMKKSY